MILTIIEIISSLITIIAGSILVYYGSKDSEKDNSKHIEPKSYKKEIILTILRLIEVCLGVFLIVFGLAEMGDCVRIIRTYMLPDVNYVYSFPHHDMHVI